MGESAALPKQGVSAVCAQAVTHSSQCSLLLSTLSASSAQSPENARLIHTGCEISPTP